MVVASDVRASLSGPAKLPKPSPVSEEQLREHVTEMLPGLLATLSQQPAGRTAQLWQIWRECGLTEERTAPALGVGGADSSI